MGGAALLGGYRGRRSETLKCEDEGQGEEREHGREMVAKGPWANMIKPLISAPQDCLDDP